MLSPQSIHTNLGYSLPFKDRISSKSWISVRTSKERHHVRATKYRPVKTVRETIDVYFENHWKRVRTLWAHTTEDCNVQAIYTLSSKYAWKNSITHTNIPNLKRFQTADILYCSECCCRDLKTTRNKDIGTWNVDLLFAEGSYCYILGQAVGVQYV